MAVAALSASAPRDFACGSTHPRDFARERASRDFWADLQEMGPDFAMGSELLGGSRRTLRGIDSADLGKRCRCVAFRAEFACKTAQKL